MKMSRIVLAILLILTSLTANCETPSQQWMHPNNNYALVIFFRSDCPYCHQFAPKFKQLSQDTGLFTYAFSLDNKGIKGYEVPIPITPEIGQAFFADPHNITVPATFLINVNTRKTVRISVGDISKQSLYQTYQSIRSDADVMNSML